MRPRFGSWNPADDEIDKRRLTIDHFHFLVTRMFEPPA
jgi:hypothetical protein